VTQPGSALAPIGSLVRPSHELGARIAALCDAYHAMALVEPFIRLLERQQQRIAA
jgi:hypothetical protein